MSQIPLIILGGRNRRAAELPAGAENLRPLHGYKGAHLRLGGRPLISLVIERMEASAAFAPIWIAGPRRIYEEVAPGYRIVDTDGGFGDNLRTAVETVRAELDPNLIAVTTCDILPDPEELERAVADLRRHQPLDFWMPQVPVSERTGALGTSQWKPRYRLQPPGEDEPLATLPGHMIVADLKALRLPFIYHVFDLFYQTRNTSVSHRRRVILRRVIGILFREDLGLLLSGKMPYALFNVIRHGLKISGHLKAGRSKTTDLEDGLRHLFLTREHRRRHPRRRGRVAVIDVMSLARDIDTEEEAKEFQQRADHHLDTPGSKAER